MKRDALAGVPRPLARLDDDAALAAGSQMARELDQLAALAAETAGSDSATILLALGPRLVPVAGHGPAAGAEAAPPGGTTHDVPILGHAGLGRAGKPIGRLLLIHSTAGSPAPNDGQLRLIAALARQVALLVELRRQEGQLWDSERQLKTLADSMPQMLWSTRPDGFHDYYNDRWYEFTGVPRGATDGTSWSGIFHPEDRERARALWHRCLETGEPYEIEYRLRHHSGVYHWVLGRAVPVRDEQDRIQRWFGTCTDVHGLKEAQQRAATLAAVAEQSSEFIGMADLNGHVIYVNEAGLGLVGLGDLAEAQAATLQDFFFPTDWEQVHSQILPRVSQGLPWEGEILFRDFKTGEAIPVLYNLFPVRDGEGRISGYATTTRDLRERKRAEDARDLLTRELSHRIKNIFTVIGGLISLAAKATPDARPFALQLRERLSALALAHEFVRPHSPDSAQHFSGRQSVHGLIRTLLAPYLEAADTRFALQGDDAPIGSRTATALALIVHEQATNAVKYGALSNETGTLTLTTALEPDTAEGETAPAAALYRLCWRERGGPSIAGPPNRQGFGTILATRSVAGQLGGQLTHDWGREGLTVEIVIPADQLAR